MSAVLIDTNVFIYAFGTDHPLKQPCLSVVEGIAGGEIDAKASIELIHEALHYWRQRLNSTEEAVRRAERVAKLIDLYSFEPSQLGACYRVMRKYPQLDTRDAIFLVTAVENGISHIVSGDSDFDSVTELERIDPRKFN